MRTTAGRPIMLGVRWCGEPPARVVEYSETLLAALEALEARGRRLPVHWNLAAQQLERGGERQERLVERIAGRTRSHGDRILPAGYAGALHPLLTAGELEKELAWALENPWGSGLRARFGGELPFLLPVYADLPRERSSGVYSRRGFRAVGVPFPPPGAPFRLGLPSPLLAFACLPLPTTDNPRELRALLRPALRGGEGPLFLLLDYGAVARAGAGRGLAAERVFAALGAWLEAPGGRGKPVFPSIEEALEGEAGRLPAPQPPCALPGLPEPPFPWDAVARGLQRKVRRYRGQAQEEGIRRLLCALAPGAEEAAAAAPARPVRSLRRTAGRAVTASMTGSAVLAGAEFDACFRAGQLVGLQRRGAAAAAGPPGLPDERQAGAHLSISGRRTPFQVDSCVSFESPSRTGLSAVLTAPLPGLPEPVSLAVEYTFDDLGPDLRIDLSLRYPEALPGALGGDALGGGAPARRPPVLARLTALAALSGRPFRTALEGVVPLEFPLALLQAGERVEVEGSYPDGSGWRALLPEDRPEAGGGGRLEPPVVLAGSRFTVHRRGPGGTAERLRLEIPSGGHRAATGARGGIHLVRLRVPPPDREGRRFLLFDPFGARFPAAARLAGQREELSLTLRLEPDSGEASPAEAGGSPPGGSSGASSPA